MANNLDFTQLKHFSGDQETAGATLLSPSARQRVWISMASITKNAGDPNEVKLLLGSRMVLTTTGPTTGGPFVGEPGEALSVEVGASTTGDWTVSAMLIGTRGHS